MGLLDNNKTNNNAGTARDLLNGTIAGANLQRTPIYSFSKSQLDTFMASSVVMGISNGVVKPDVDVDDDGIDISTLSLVTSCVCVTFLRKS